MNAALPSSAPPRSPQARGRSTCKDCATRGICPVARLDPVLFDTVAPLVKERAFGRAAVLQRQGEALEAQRVVKSGTVLLCRDSDMHARLPVAIAPAGQIVGASHLVDVPALLTVIAASDTRVCELTLDALAPLGVLTAPAFRRTLAESVFRTVGILADWAHVTRLTGVRARLAGALLVLGAQQKSERVRLPGHAVLGELLGVTRESVARAMTALEGDGCITRLGRTYCELNQALLKQSSRHV